MPPISPVTASRASWPGPARRRLRAFEAGNAPRRHVGARRDLTKVAIGHDGFAVGDPREIEELVDRRVDILDVLHQPGFQRRVARHPVSLVEMIERLRHGGGTERARMTARLAEGGFVHLHPTSRWMFKCWPAERNAELIDAQEPGGVAARFLNGTPPSLEAQLCNLADAIAYNAHDIDDGVRSGLLTLEQMQDVSLFARYHAQTLAEYPQLQGRRVLYETIRRMLSDQVYDVINATRTALQQHAPTTADEARQCPALVQFSAAMYEESKALKSFLFRNLYRHPQVMQTTDGARAVVKDLFNVYLAKPQEMPAAYAQRSDVPRAVADYLSGMTDRFATREHARLTA